ncbi:MAG: hypothetical protein Q7T56_19440 [Nocardioidaceae bacterium]|nr:hypothetical protein [Nocardioidaceae bacterium]
METRATHDTDVRIGWLLKLWRQRASEVELRMQGPFARRLRAQAEGVNADASRVSRWESGRLRVNRPILRGYEQVVGLDHDLLVATVEGMWRDHGLLPRGTAEPPSRREVAGGLDDCFQRLDAGQHDGGTWFALAGLVATPGTVVYLPEPFREEAASRLVEEVPRAVGQAWVRRLEAMRGMLQDELMRPHLVRAIGRQVTEPSSQAVTDLVANLHEVGGTAPLEMMVRLARHESAPVRAGALWGLEHRLVVHRLPRELMPALGRTLAMVVADDSGRNVDLALRVAEQLPAEHTGSVAAVVRQRRGADATVQESADRVASRRAAAAAMEALEVDADDVLLGVLGEAFDARRPNLQHEAWMLLMVGPFRSALADHLVRRCLAGDPLADVHAAGLTYLATAAQRSGVVELATAHTGVSPGHAFRALAHVPGALDPRVAGGVPGADEMYALGMGRHPRLHRLAEDPAAPAEVRSAARWWVEHGGALHDPAAG